MTEEDKRYLEEVANQYDLLHASYRRQLPTEAKRMKLEIKAMACDLYPFIDREDLAAVFLEVRRTINRWPTSADFITALKQVDRDKWVRRFEKR